MRPLPTWLLLPLLVTMAALLLLAWPLGQPPATEELAAAEAVRVAAMPCASPLLRQEVELFISVLRMPLEELELLQLELRAGTQTWGTSAMQLAGTVALPRANVHGPAAAHAA